MKNMNTLSTLVSRSLAYALSEYVSTLQNLPVRADLDKSITDTIDNIRAILKVDFDFDRAFAFSLSVVYRTALERKMISVRDYISLLAEHKERAYMEGDFGAFGDLFEILVRLAALPSLNLAHGAHLYVKPQEMIDITIHGVRFEVGHNGKTWTHATINDAMFGPFEGVIYGVFDNETAQDVFVMARQGRIEKAIDIISAYTGVWVDKNQFAEDMQNLYPRGKAFAIKSSKVMSQYNAGFARRFIMAIENDEIQTLESFFNKD